MADDVHAIQRVLDAGGVEHYLPFRHNSIVIGLPDVAKARSLLAQDRQARDSASTYRDGDLEGAELRWGSPVDARQLERSSSQFVRDNKAALGAIPREVQYRLFNAIYPGYAREAEDAYTKATAGVKGATPWADLNPAVRDVAVDFKYQQGIIYKAQVQAIMNNDEQALHDYIVDDPRTARYERGRNRAPYLQRRR